MRIGELNELLNELNELEDKEFHTPYEKERMEEIRDKEVFIQRRTRADMMNTKFA